MKPLSSLRSVSFSIAAVMLLAMIGCGGGGGGGDDTAAIPSADLSLTKTVDVITPAVGDQIVFTITVTNAGPANATGVVVTDQLPAGFTYDADSSGGAYDPASGAWSVGTLAVGASQTLTITATVVEGAGNYTNRAQVTANEIDPNANNDFDGAVAAPAGISVTINQIQTACETNTTSDNAYVTVLDQLQNPLTSGVTFTLNESLNSQNYAVTNFSVATNNETTSISIVVDYSLSIFDSGVISEVKASAIDFINQLAPGDEAQVITFNETITTFPANNGFTTDKQQLIDAVSNAPDPAAPGTELYNAIISGINNTAQRPSTNNRAVVVVTDGRNNVYPPSPPNYVEADVIPPAQNNQIPVYTIGLGAESDWNELMLIATETNGQFFPSFQSDDLPEIFTSLADILNSQYVITYASVLPGGANAPGTLTVNADSNGLVGSDTAVYAACP